MSPVAQFIYDGTTWVNETRTSRTSMTAQATTTRDATLQPFASTSPFNTSLGSGAVYANDAMTSSIRGGVTAIASAQWSISVVRATSSDPMCTLELPWGTWQVVIPTNAIPAAGTDNHLSVIQPDGKTVLETWTMAKVTDTRWKSGYAVLTDLYGSGLVNGARASGISQCNGLIRTHEVAQLNIPHALSISVDNTQLKSVGPDAAGNSGIWPARRQDGDGRTAYSGVIPMGSLFALPATTDLTTLGLTREGLMLAQAMQDYGVYVLIRGGTVSLHAEPTIEQSYSTALANMRSDFSRKLHGRLVHISNSTATTVAGGGTRRRAPAASLT
jgi:hypothetical protein